MTHLIIQCGSSARGDINKNSDIDIACIWSDTPPEYEKIKQEHGDVMFYSAETICRMRNNGSLFLTHLDLDGKYISGNRKLTALYKGFRPTPNQLNKSLIESRAFLLTLQWFPNSTQGYLWLNDVLFICLRNIIYCENAKNSIYEFGFETALKAFNLCESDIQAIRGIREGKYAYRKGTNKLDNPIQENEIVTVTSKISKSPINLTRGGKTNWPEKIINYWDERLIERAIINGEIKSKSYMQLIKTHNYSKISLRKAAQDILMKQLYLESSRTASLTDL